MSTNHTTIPTLPRLVCLVGRSHELRQELAARLSQAHGYTDVNITPIIREYAALVFPDADLDEAPDATEGVPLWEAFGAVCARLEPSVWVEPWRQAVEHELETGGRVICTDARDPATLALAGQLGGTRVLLGSALPDTVSQERFEWICEHPGQGADLFEHLVEHLRTPARHEHAPPRHCDTKRGPERELARSLESAQQTWTALAACLRAWAEDPAARARTQARREELERAHRQACLELGERYLAAQMARERRSVNRNLCSRARFQVW